MLPRSPLRWIALALTLAILLALRPTPIPSPLVTSVTAAGQAISEHQPETALFHLEVAISLVPGNASLYLHAARTSLLAREPERGLEFLLTAQNYPVDEAELESLRGELLLALGDLRGASAAWESAGEFAPHPEEILRNLALTYLDLGHSVEAYNAFSDLVFLLPNDLEALLHLGVLAAAIPTAIDEYLQIAHQHMRAGDPLIREMIAIIEEYRGDSSQAQRLALVGLILMQHEEWRLAEYAFREALTVDPGFVDARAYHGLALLKIGRDGISELLAAKEADPEAMLPRVLIGMYYLEIGEAEEALLELETAADLDATNPAVLAQLGAALDAAGDVDQALMAYRSATVMDPENPDFWLLLAQYALSREIEIESVALQAARNAVALKPRNAVGLGTLGYGYYLIENYMMSERLLDESVQIDPTLASTHYYLGLLRLAQGQTSRARAALELAVLLDPGGTVGRMAELALDYASP